LSLTETSEIYLQNDVEIPIPKYFILERAKALKEREKLLGQILSKLGGQEKDGVSQKKYSVSLQCFIKIISL